MTIAIIISSLAVIMLALPMFFMKKEGFHIRLGTFIFIVCAFAMSGMLWYWAGRSDVDVKATIGSTGAAPTSTGISYGPTFRARAMKANVMTAETLYVGVIVIQASSK